MKQEEGAIEFGAVIILFFLSAILAGSALFIQTSMVYFTKNNLQQEEKSAADTLLKEIVTSLQPLRSFEYDNKDNPLLTSLKNKYANYGLEFHDVSSGYHLDFLTDRDLQDGKLKEFLFANGSPSDFIAYRNSNGLSKDKNGWRTFLKDTAWEACVTYGWIHKSHIDSFAFATVCSSHKTTDISALYPLVNEFPLINVNMIHPDIIIPLVLRQSFKIEKPNEKAEAFKSRLLNGPVALSDISTYLEIPNDHALFAYLGTKTAFWRITFQLRQGMYVEAIVAAIPKKEGGIQEIANYRLIERVMKYET
jgi:hypothetical protein